MLHGMSVTFEKVGKSNYTLEDMTHLLKHAFAKAAKLSENQQNRFARWVLDELDSEKRWDKAFAKSQDMLSLMADKALKEYGSGKTKPLHFHRT
jgi:hypothetical protein